MLMFAAVPAIQGLPQTSDVNEISMGNVQTSAPKSPGQVLIDFDAETAHAETGSLGAEWDGQYFWTSCRGLVNPPHKLFKWDISGNLIATYNQPAQASTWGFRDLAFDGTYLYGGSENGFWRINPADGTTTLMFASIAPMTLIRALTWVPSEGMFYTGSFGLGWFKFNPTGTTITPVANPALTAVYGMAYDDMNDTIWVFDQTGTPQTTFFEYNYHTLALTGRSWVVPMLTGLTAQIAGGAFYATDCISGKAVLGGLVQGTVKDRLFVMELRDAETNQPPVTPAAPTGSDTGYISVEYNFTATTTDPDGDNISYMFDWGNGNNSGWLGPYASGTPKTQAYTWNAVGVYDVKVKAKDIHDDESGWSAVHPIAISAAPAPTLQIGNITGGLFKVKAIVKNTGIAAAANVKWNISLAGGAFIGKESNGNILSLAPGGQREISSGFILGFGKTVITVKATCTESSATKDQNATILLFFIKIK